MGEFSKDILTSYYKSLAKVDDRYRDLERARIRHLWCEDKLREADQLCIQNGFQRISSLLLSGSIMVSEFNQKLIESTLLEVGARFQKYRDSNKYLDDIRVFYEREFKAIVDSLELQLANAKKHLSELDKQVSQVKTERIAHVFLLVAAALLSLTMSYWYALMLIILTGFFSLIAYR